MKNFNIGVRLGIGFGVICLFLLIVGFYSIVKLGQLDTEISKLVDDKYPKAVMLNDIRNQINTVARAVRNLYIFDNKEEASRSMKMIADARESVNKDLDALGKIVRSDTGKAALKDIVDTRTAYLADQKAVLTHIEAGERDKARDIMSNNLRKSQGAYLAAINKMLEHQEKEVVKVGQDTDKMVMQAKSIVISLLVISILLAVAFSFIVVRSITRPIAPMVDAARRIADGDLNVTIEHLSNDEIGQLSDSLRTMAENLRGMISKVATTSTQIAAASSQLHSTAEQIATGAEEVAAQAATVATAGEEMSATSGDIAQNCQLASEGAQRAAQTASDGAQVVEKTVAAMGQIAEKVMESARTVEELGARSDQIGAIIGTIEDIADQTNLLALNAAIEAARAGEQGRGFAVVADEVRALAERTTKATKEISEMIKAIQRETKGAVAVMEQGVQQVESGTMEAAKSGEALQDILAQVNEVAMQVHQIATAAEEQTATTSEISSNMIQITEVVQQTSHGAQESATAAAQLNGNAEELQHLVRQFRL